MFFCRAIFDFPAGNGFLDAVSLLTEEKIKLSLDVIGNLSPALFIAMDGLE